MFRLVNFVLLVKLLLVGLGHLVLDDDFLVSRDNRLPIHHFFNLTLLQIAS